MNTPELTKHEWRKKEKATYIPMAKPEFIDIPSYQFITIAGEGSPSEPLFAQCVSALYAMAYAIKMTPKKMSSDEINQKLKGYTDYTVYPLEGIWSLNEQAIQNFNGQINKEDFAYQLMLRQPDFVTKAFYDEMLDLV